MKYRQLGSSDLHISEISLGSWLTYGVGVDDSSARACVDRAFDLGVNFIDTSNIYGRGRAEEFLGRVLQSHPRSSYILATKLFFPMTDTDRGLSAKQVYKQIDASLHRLRTDYVDLYQCHRYDVGTPLEETMEALTNVVREGKARYLGFSEWTADQIRASLAIPGVEKFVSSQPQYSMLWRRWEDEIFALCAANGIGQIVWSPLAQGALTGKYLPSQPPPRDSRAVDPEMGSMFNEELLSDYVLETVQRLKVIATGEGLTVAQIALAWVLRRPEISSAITGASRPVQVEENVKASGVTLSPETLRTIDSVVDPVLKKLSDPQKN
jgi:aryl-alcohol dehydrogenase-like predicted oxidoreductase